jgi:phosphoglycerate dehydrogenase-like enzyme
VKKLNGVAVESLADSLHAFEPVPDQPPLKNAIGTFNLFGKTIGVIGTGQIGVAFCKIMLGFGCKIIAYDLSICQNFEKSQAISNMGLPRHIKPIALAHGG